MVLFKGFILIRRNKMDSGLVKFSRYDGRVDGGLKIYFRKEMC